MRIVSLFFITCLVFFCAVKNVFSAFSFKINSVDTSQISSIDTEVKIELSITDLPSESYFMVGWQKGDNYFGYTKSDNDGWVKLNPLSSKNCTDYKKISDTSTTSITLTSKIGEYDQIENGDYSIKVFRFTSSCGSYSKTTDNFPITINITPLETPTPTQTSTPTLSPTESETTNTPTPTITPTPTLSSAPTITPTPTISKSIYKINTVKDSDGNTLSNIKIYIDGFYTHHYAPEAIIFCNGCHCDDSNSIDCELGAHTIKLAKDSYSDWIEQKNLSNGQTYEVNPILSKIIESTPTPTNSPTPTITPSPSPSLTITTTPTPSFSDTEVLGDSTDSADTILNLFTSSATPSVIAGSPQKNQKKYQSSFYRNISLLGVTITLVSTSILYFRLRRVKIQ